MNLKFLIAIIFTILPLAANAVVGIGGVAENILSPVSVASGFVSTACIIVGVACLFASVIKYFEHRKSPLYVPISTVIWLVIIGLALVALPFAYLITENGIPYTLIKWRR